MRLRDKVAVITGAGGSLGSAIAHRYLAEGCRGVVLVDISEQQLERVVSTLQGGWASVVGDVSDVVCLEQAMRVALDKFGKLDVMVNNAGVLSPNARLHNVAVNDWKRVFDVNVMGVVNGTVAAVNIMRKSNGGVIINTASVSAITAWSHAGPYGASKAAIISITKTTAVEYASDNIRANCVCPGSFESTMFSGVPDAAIQDIARRHPLGLGTPEKLVGTYVHLASDESEWMTGSVVVVDGGYSAP
ncbi:MAG: SDR family NAD(P)-dependent oxidoreductase [Ilumatobacteraceae bacterium]